MQSASLLKYAAALAPRYVKKMFGAEVRAKIPHASQKNTYSYAYLKGPHRAKMAPRSKRKLATVEFEKNLWMQSY